MVTRDEMQELVDAHAALDDPLETAIWIRSHDREAWLVEIISNMGADATLNGQSSSTPGSRSDTD